MYLSHLDPVVVATRISPNHLLMCQFGGGVWQPTRILRKRGKRAPWWFSPRRTGPSLGPILQAGAHPLQGWPTFFHEKSQVPKMEGFLNLIAGYFGGGKTPFYKPYPYSLYRFRIPPFLGTNDMFGDFWDPNLRFAYIDATTVIRHFGCRKMELTELTSTCVGVV